MNGIKINSHTGPYSILIENYALNYSGELIGKRFNECKVCIISDDIVSKIYLEIVKDSLQLKDFQVFDFIINLQNYYPNGFDSTIKISDYVEFDVDRIDCTLI